MADTVTKVDRKVSKALAAFTQAKDALIAAETALESEEASVNAQIDSLIDYRDSIEQRKGYASSVRSKLDEFLALT